MDISRLMTWRLMYGIGGNKWFALKGLNLWLDIFNYTPVLSIQGLQWVLVMMLYSIPSKGFTQLFICLTLLKSNETFWVITERQQNDPQYRFRMAFVFKCDAYFAPSLRALLMIIIVFESVYKDDLNYNIRIDAIFIIYVAWMNMLTHILSK